MNYQVHPETYGIELRDGMSVDDYIAQARGFSSTAEFREYRDAPPERRAEMRRQRDNNSTDCSDEDRRRTLEFLRIASE
jgi:hypothetical protein